MTSAVSDPGVDVRERAATSRARPVLLATLETPLLHEASRIAVDAAVESGQPLLVVNAVVAQPTRCTLALGWDHITPPAVEESLNEPAALARSVGVRVERICLRSPHPVDALVELAAEREVGLLVLGADPDAMRKRRYRRSMRKLVERCSCLVWLP